MFVEINRELKIDGASFEEKKIIKQALTYINPKWVEAKNFGRRTYGISQYIKQYRCEGSTLIIPRGFLYQLIRLFGLPEKIVDKTASFDKVGVLSRIVLRPLQEPWIKDMLKHKQGICVAPPGAGKTVMLLEASSRIGQPTFWLTDQLNLADQVKERAGFFIDAGNIGMIGGGKNKIGDFLTIGMIQTLSKRDLSGLSHSFGVVVLDECHIAPTNTCLKVLSQLAPEYLYGATATPFREDSLEVMMYNAIGPIITQMDREEVVEIGGIIPAEILICNTGVSLPSWNKMEYKDVIDYIYPHKKRNEMIIFDVLSEIAQGNICIILTTRIKHGIILRDMLTALGIDCEHIHSKQSKKVSKQKLDRFINGEVPLILATYKLLSKGFDHQISSRIFFALPQKAKSLVEQAKGRIERIIAEKSNALVYDYVDDIRMLKNQSELRLLQYKEHNLKITRRK